VIILAKYDGMIFEKTSGYSLRLRELVIPRKTRNPTDTIKSIKTTTINTLIAPVKKAMKPTIVFKNNMMAAISARMLPPIPAAFKKIGIKLLLSLIQYRT